MINHECIALKDKRLGYLTEEQLAIHKNKNKRGLCIIKSPIQTSDLQWMTSTLRSDIYDNHNDHNLAGALVINDVNSC